MWAICGRIVPLTSDTHVAPTGDPAFTAGCASTRPPAAVLLLGGRCCLAVFPGCHWWVQRAVSWAHRYIRPGLAGYPALGSLTRFSGRGRVKLLIL